MTTIETTTSSEFVPAMAAGEQTHLPITLLTPSPTNPRRHFTKKSMDELIKTVKEHGMIFVPMLVRQIGNGYEIIAGERRFRAAVAVGLPSVPVRIVAMTDVQVLEVQNIENLQREDVHPLDEAEGYLLLMQRAGYTVLDIATKLGKSESYVYQRLKLTDLTDDGKSAFWDEKITPAMAMLIAKLQPADQLSALAECGKGYIESARELAQWITQNVHLKLAAAPWKKDDATLLLVAGSCEMCPKRTGFAPSLFPEVKDHDICTDRSCFHAKRAAFVERKKEKLLQRKVDVAYVSGNWDQGAKKDASALPSRGQYRIVDNKELKNWPQAKKALVVDGQGAGQVIHVVMEQGRAERSVAEIERQKKQREIDRRTAAIREASVNLVLESVRYPLGLETLRWVVSQMWDRAWNDLRCAILKRRKIEAKRGKNSYGGSYIDRKGPVEQLIQSMSADELAELLMEIAIGQFGDYSDERILAVAPMLNVDLSGVAKAIDEATPARKVVAKKAVKKPTKKVPAKKRGGK